MKIVFWIAFLITVAEFIASPVNVLRGSAIHLQRFREVKFPLNWARRLAVIQLLAVSAVIVGIWLPGARLIGGCLLAASFIFLSIWAARAKRPIGDILGLGFFIACALIVALY